MGTVTCTACGRSVLTPNKGDHVTLSASGHGKIVNEQIYEDYILKHGDGPFEVISDAGGSLALAYPGSTHIVMTVPYRWTTPVAKAA